ncbi:hypothetical protein HBDW_30280 [Herbaspirillum sp. DW155]|uniref:hypothetical protein n=1 Tax=Herbaspirillum sp. DW155 TaxID=3095609 RepID=UPI0030894BC7|nr:hypothetical protein HBDW_30280 [Herbaspirillum sp. DW155]
MQKEKTSEWTSMAASMAAPMIALTALLLGALPSARAEDASTPAVTADSLKPNATVGDMIRLAKQAGEREFAAKLNPARNNAGKDSTAAAAPVMEKNPVLLALYGTDRNYKAELDVNGQSRVVTVPGPLQKMGPWKHIALLEEGVLLSKQPPENSPPARTRAGSTSQGSTLLACQQKETCLFLSVPKGGGDSRSLAAPDAQARLLASQLPGGARALEFGGKPQPSGDRINPGNAAAASRK